MKNMMDGKVIVVIGAGSIGEGWGNGKAAAVLYAREGGKIIAVDVDKRAAEQTQSIIHDEGGICEIIEADVTNSAQVEEIFKFTMSTFGRVDVLHNNVGISKTGGPIETSEEDWDKIISVNQKSIFLTSKYALPIMIEQKSGSIINISSIAAIRWLGFPYCAYTASKAAIIGMTENMAIEHAPYGIRANCILPGLMDTPMIYAPLTQAYGGNIEEMKRKRNSQCPMGYMGDAWDIANASLFLASDLSKYITGTKLVVDGGLTLSSS